MAERFGIDTSILVRLVTGDPKEGFESCVHKLCALVEGDDAEVFVSNRSLAKPTLLFNTTTAYPNPRRAPPW
jgi:hypothetical protein